MAIYWHQVGTLDTLMLLSDELAKSDAVLEATVTKTADTLKTLLHGDQDAWTASLVVAESALSCISLYAMA